MWPNPQETEEILNGTIIDHFIFCACEIKKLKESRCSNMNLHRMLTNFNIMCYEGKNYCKCFFSRYAKNWLTKVFWNNILEIKYLKKGGAGVYGYWISVSGLIIQP